MGGKVDQIENARENATFVNVIGIDFWVNIKKLKCSLVDSPSNIVHVVFFYLNVV